MSGTRNRIKVQLSYNNEKDRDALVWLVKWLFPDVKIRELAEKDGYKHTVLTVRNPKGNTK